MTKLAIFGLIWNTEKAIMGPKLQNVNKSFKFQGFESIYAGSAAKRGRLAKKKETSEKIGSESLIFLVQY